MAPANPSCAAATPPAPSAVEPAGTAEGLGQDGAKTDAQRASAGPLRWWRRPGQLLIGLTLYALSMALLLHAGLGAMPWDVLQQGVVRRTGASFGLVTLVVGVVVLLGWIPLRQRPGIGTVANVVVISALVDPMLALVPQPSGLVSRIGFLALGIGVNALATACYIGARLGPGPRDGLMTGLVARTGGSVRLVRTSIEVVVVGVGWVLGGTLGVGTLAYALGVGPLVQPLLRRLSLPPVTPRRPRRPRGRGGRPVG